MSHYQNIHSNIIIPKQDPAIIPIPSPLLNAAFKQSTVTGKIILIQINHLFLVCNTNFNS